MIAKRLQYEDDFKKIKTLLEAWDFLKYVLNPEHPNHKGMTISEPVFNDLGVEAREPEIADGTVSSLCLLCELCQKKGRSLVDEIVVLSGSGGPLAPIKAQDVEEYLAKARSGRRPVFEDDGRRVLRQLDLFLSGLKETARAYRSQGKSRWKGDLIEPLSICPTAGADLSASERMKIVEKAFADLAIGAKAMAVWHCGKVVNLDGQTVEKDDLHLLLWNLMEVPDRILHRPSEVRRRQRADYKIACWRLCERLVKAMNRERAVNGRSPMPTLKERIDARSEQGERRQIPAAISRQLSKEGNKRTLTIDYLAGLLVPLGWRVYRVGKRKSREESIRQTIAIKPPYSDRTYHFRWFLLRDDIVWERQKTKDSEHGKKGKADDARSNEEDPKEPERDCFDR